MFKTIIKSFLKLVLSSTPKNNRIKTQLHSQSQKKIDPLVYSDDFTYNMHLSTDTATIALFDPEQLTHRLKDDCDWWIDIQSLPEVSQGDMVIVGLGGDGFYKVRVTNQELSEGERDYAKYVTPDLGVQVISGKLFIGVGEEIPGEGGPLEQGLDELSRCGGAFIQMPNGHYTVRCYGIDIFEIPGEPTPECRELEDILPDVVIQILPGKATIPVLKEDPSFFCDPDKKYLFKSSHRTARKKLKTAREKLQPGSILHAKIMKLGDTPPPNNLVVRENYNIDPSLNRISWPLGYTIVIDDWKDLKWADRVTLKVCSIDKINKIIHTDIDQIVRDKG